MNKDKNIIAYYEIYDTHQQLVDVKYIDKSDNPMDYQGDYLIYMGNNNNQLGNNVTYFGKKMGITEEQYNALSEEQQNILQDYSMMYKVDIDMLDINKLHIYEALVKELV